MADTVEFSSWNLARTMPAPIAYAYQHYASVADQDLVRKAKTLFAVAEVSARYLVAVLSADYLSLDLSSRHGTLWDRATKWLGGKDLGAERPDVPPWVEMLPIGRSLEFGVWIHALRDVAKLIPPKSAFVPEAVTTAKNSKALGLLEQLNTLRNRFAHPGGAFDHSDDEILAFIRQGKPTLARWLSELRYLAGYPLCVGLTRQRFARERTRHTYDVKRFMGLAAHHTNVEIETEIEIHEHQPFLVDRVGNALLYLWPFIVSGEPGPESGFGSLFVFERQTSARLGDIEYVGVGQRSTFPWHVPSGGSSLSWLRSERASMPGIVRLPTNRLDVVHRPAPDNMLGKTVGETRQYRLIERLGEGAMGVVYVARDAEERPYAVKILRNQQRDAGLVRRFEQEIEKLNKLGRVSGIISLLDWGRTTDVEGNRVPYYVMDYAERGDLSTYIRQNCVPLDEDSDPTTWDLEPRFAILEQLATALAELHRLQLIHRDVKPPNVLLMGDGGIRLCDLGLVKVMTSGPSARLTRDFSIVGSFEYAPPEQLEPGIEASPTWDVFAFGVLGFELLMGRLPQRRERAAPAPHANALKEQKVVQIIPASIRKVILTCTQIEPAERFQHGDDLVAALTPALDAVRKAELIVNTEPPGGIVLVDGSEYPANSRIQVTSGVHIVAAVLGQLSAPPRIVRLAPLAELTLPVRLLSEEERAQVSDAIVAANPAIVRQYLDAVNLQLVTKSVGYGTTREIDDKNSLQIWELVKRELGDAAIPPLIETLASGDANSRMKALKLLLHFAVNSPASVDLQKLQHVMRHEQVPTILHSWIEYVQRSSDRNWPLLVDLLTSEDIGYQSAGIPSALRNLVARQDTVAGHVVEALIKVLPSIPNAAARSETVRSLTRRTEAVPIFGHLLKHDPDANVRAIAAHAFGDSASTGGFDALLESLNTDGSDSVRVASARALLKIDRSRAIQAFEVVLKQGDSATKAAVEEASKY